MATTDADAAQTEETEEIILKRARNDVERAIFSLEQTRSRTLETLDVTLPPDSPANLTRNIFAAADALSQRAYFTYLDRGMTDDHTPLNEIGIPVIDLIDFDFPPWHTAGDTLDKISAESLEIVGRVALYDLVQFELK